MTEGQHNGDPNGRVMVKLENVERIVMRIDTHVTGGTRPQEGLNHRVLMLEHARREEARMREAEARRFRNRMAGLMAVLTLVATVATDWIKGLFSGGKHP